MCPSVLSTNQPEPAVKNLMGRVIANILRSTRTHSEQSASPGSSPPGSPPQSPPPSIPPSVLGTPRSQLRCALSARPREAERLKSTAVRTRFVLNGRSGVIWNNRKIAECEMLGLAFDDAASRQPSWQPLTASEFLERASPWDGAESDPSACWAVLTETLSQGAKKGLPTGFIFGNLPLGGTDWEAFRSYVPAPTSEITSKPPVSFPFGRGSLVKCEAPFVSANKGSNLAPISSLEEVGRVIAILFGREWNQSKGKFEIRRFVLLHSVSRADSTINIIVGLQQVCVTQLREVFGVCCECSASF